VDLVGRSAKEEHMADTIRGPVINIVDGDTFDMRVTHTGRNNQYQYNNEERIRIANIDAPDRLCRVPQQAGAKGVDH